MTIEAGSAQGASRPAAASESRKAKSKDDSANGGGGGFMAVLATVETAQAAAPAASDASASARKNPGAKTQGKAAKANDAVTEDSATGGIGGGVQDGSATAADDLIAKSVTDTALPAVDPTAADPATSTNAPMDAAALLAQSTAWAASTKGASGTAPAENAGATAPVVATGPRPAPVPVANGAAGANVPPELATAQLAEGIQKAAGAHGESKTKSLQEALVPKETAAVPEGKVLASNQKLTTDLQMTPALAAAVASAAVAATSRREEQPRERSIFRSSNSAEGAAAPQALSSATPTLTVSSAPEVVAPTDAFVAEKVSYWISNNVQNAEMKLDGIGDRPVEVSIRMQGNEAHVAFRTDELQARAALENASVHLKDMLQREGLVLSGVSVGTAGTGDSGAQDRQSRQGGRQTTVATLQPIGGDLRGVSSRVANGGLDLFV